MRILILGGTGMLGHKLWQRLGARFVDCRVTVRGTRSDYRRFALFDDSRVIENVDVTDAGRLTATLHSTEPDVIINCIALTKRREAPARPAASILLNAWLPHHLAEWTATHGARLITLSTDCVFDGAQGGYTEDDAPNAHDVYGRTKALGEVAYDNALTLRTSFIGRELEHATELLEWFLAQSGKTVRGFRRALYTGISSLYCADVIGDIIEHFPRLSGLYQITSEVITKYDLLCLARAAFDLDVKIEPDDSVMVLRNLDGTKFHHDTGLATPAWSKMSNDLAGRATPYRPPSVHPAPLSQTEPRHRVYLRARRT